jgi:RNA polymerase sigma-70 factor (ECF subfamily)
LSVEIRDRVEASLRALPRDQRIAVVLRDIEGMSYEEIAVSMGTEIGTVKSRIGRARASLRVLLADLVDSPGEGTSS